MITAADTIRELRMIADGNTVAVSRELATAFRLLDERDELAERLRELERLYDLVERDRNNWRESYNGLYSDYRKLLALRPIPSVGSPA
jgi:hypothetical protein